MRRMLFALALLTACQMTAADDPAAPTALQDDEISVTSLDAPPQAPETAAQPDTHPKPRPETLDQPTTVSAVDPAAEPVASTPEDALPEVPKSAEQVLCEKAKGQWSVAGKTGAYICIKPTRDGGKQCTKKGDCQGLCLARSGTCAPFAPLFGCNDVLEKDGRRVTLCID